MAQTQNSNRERRLAITAIGPSRNGLALSLMNAIIERGCLIIDCRFAPMGECLSLSLLVGGNWSALARLESALPSLATRLGVQIQFESTELKEPDQSGLRPYAVEVIAPAKTELLPRILDFFQTQHLQVSELMSQEYNSSHTGAAMCNLTMVVLMPLDQHPQVLRESFMDLCDELNADGIMDPIKA